MHHEVEKYEQSRGQTLVREEVEMEERDGEHAGDDSGKVGTARVG